MILSVVIPTRDKAAQLRRTLAALARQEAADPWEIVVVDDASRDETSRLLAAEVAGAGGRLRCVSCERNVGRAAARNLGWRAATGRWILFLDDDIVAPPGLLDAHLDRLRAHPGWGTIGRVVTDRSIVDAPHFHYLDTRGVAKVGDGPVPARYFVTQNAAVPREALLSVGGFDERFRAYGFEDAELAFRLEEQQGVRFMPVHDPVPTHVHHHTLAQFLAKKRECGAVSLPLLATLHPDRILEMRLHWVIETPQRPLPSRAARLLRVLCAGGVSRPMAFAASRWPADARHRPAAARIHARLLDFLVLCAYRQGLLTTVRHL